jgi:hypothetical protein
MIGGRAVSIHDLDTGLPTPPDDGLSELLPLVAP